MDRLVERATREAVYDTAALVVKKVAMNPVVLLWYDHARNRLGYEGDLGDFIVDCVEGYFRLLGYKIVIRREIPVEGEGSRAI